MASYYVYSGAAGAGTGADWANAFTTLSAALTGKAAGDIFYVAHDHAESSAVAISVTAPGTTANPNFIYCVNRAGSVPPVHADLRTTATIQTTGNVSITIGGSYYMYGIQFTAGNSTGSPGLSNVGTSAAQTVTLEACVLKIGSTGSVGQINSAMNAQDGCTLRLIDCDLIFSQVAQTFQAWGNIQVRGGRAAPSGTVPTSMFAQASNRACRLEIEGMDCSTLVTGKELIAPTGPAIYARVRNCRLGVGGVISSTPTAPGRPNVEALNCDSGDTGYKSEKYGYEGTRSVETTIVRSGGASDGLTPISWKVVTTANAKYVLPFECEPIAVWNETIGSARTVTVEGIWGGGAVPNDDEIWIDVEYLGTSGFPKSSFVSTKKASGLAAAAAVASSAASWGGSTTPFKLSATFTPQEKGWVYVRPKVGKSSSTFYIDPIALLS